MSDQWDDGRWDDGYSAVLAEAEAASSANAMAVADAVYAQVTIADRLRAAVGVTVALRTAACLAEDHRIVGAVADVCTDAVLIRHPSGFGWAVMLAGIEEITGLPEGHRQPDGIVQARRSAGALLRPCTGSDVTVALRGSRIAGRLERVGADHLQLASRSGTALLPLAAVCWARFPADS